MALLCLACWTKAHHTVKRGAENANFGIIVEYTYRTRKVEQFSTFALSWSWDNYDKLFDLWQNWAPYAATRFTLTFTLYKDEVTAMGMFAGPKHELLSLLPDFIKNPSKRGPITDEYQRYDKALDGLMLHYVRGDSSIAHEHGTFAAVAVMCNSLEEGACTDFKDVIRESPGTSSIVFLARGGRICGLTSDFNAYRYRTQSLEPMFRTTWQDDQDCEPCLNWVRQSYRKLKTNFGEVYKNWIYSEVGCGMYEWYGNDIPRLVSIKRKFDPENTFSNPQTLLLYVTNQQIVDWDLPSSILELLKQQGSLAAN